MIIVNKSYTDTHTKRKRIEREKKGECTNSSWNKQREQGGAYAHTHYTYYKRKNMCAENTSIH